MTEQEQYEVYGRCQICCDPLAPGLRDRKLRQCTPCWKAKMARPEAKLHDLDIWLPIPWKEWYANGE